MKPTMKIICFLLSILFLSNCGNHLDDIETTIDSAAKDSKEEMDKNFSSIRNNFDSIYIKTLNESDSISKEKIIYFRSVLLQTTGYLDSIRDDLQKYDSKDIRNNNLIKEKFVQSPLGDSIFNKLKHTFYLAESIPSIKVKKDSINQISKNVLNDFDVSGWKNFFFGLNSPGGAMMIVYGFEYELYRASVISIKNNTPVPLARI